MAGPTYTGYPFASFTAFTVTAANIFILSKNSIANVRGWVRNANYYFIFCLCENLLMLHHKSFT